METIRYAPVERQPALPYLQVILDTVRYTGYVGDHGHAAHVIHCTMGLTLYLLLTLTIILTLTQSKTGTNQPIHPNPNPKSYCT